MNKLIILLVFSTIVCQMYGQNPADTLKLSNFTIPKIEKEFTVDGKLEEDQWAEALKFELKYEVYPGENIQPPVKTEVFLSYNSSYLFIAFKAYDPEPSEIQAHFTDRDNLGIDDWVGIVLDTYNDVRRSFDFLCNPFGIQEEAIETESSYDSNWDAIWRSSGVITDFGYSVEMAIPFSSLRFQKNSKNQTWGFDAIRSYPRKVRHHIGIFPRDRNNNCYLCQATKISGFESAKPGKNIELDPAIVAQVSQERENENSGPFKYKNKTIEPSLSARWGITPNLTMNGTINPDYSQVEADAVQLDINEPFALWYPEKRPFFTEGLDFFSSRINTIYTRTLRDPIWGLKFSGKEKSNTIGSYVVNDNLTNLIFPGAQSSNDTSLSVNSTSAVIRYKHDFNNKYTTGLLLTDRESKDYLNRVFGFDGNFRLTQKDRIIMQFLGTSTKYPGNIDTIFGQPHGLFWGYAADVTYEHSSRNIGWYMAYKNFSDDFRSDQGFIPQVGYKKADLGANYTWYNKKNNEWWSNMNLQTNYSYKTFQNNNLLLRYNDIRFNFNGSMNSHLLTQFSISKEFYNDKSFDQKSFYIHHCMRPVGTFHYWVNLTLGNKIDYANTRLGKRINTNIGARCDIGKHLFINLDYTYEKMNISNGHLYTAHIFYFQTKYQFTKQLFIKLIIQYRDYWYNTILYDDPPDRKNQGINTQFLFSYKLNPQTVIFIGYSDNYSGNENIDLIQTNRALFFKVGYAILL